MIITAVFHGPKANGVAGLPGQVASNPPLSLAGMENIHRLAQKWKTDSIFPKEFDGFYSSRMARATDTASVLANEWDMDFLTLRKLGQMANKEGDVIHYYPGCEEESLVTWQADAIDAITSICNRHGSDHHVLVVSHRPIIGGIIALSQGIQSDEVALDKVVSDPLIVAAGFVQFDVKVVGGALDATQIINP